MGNITWLNRPPEGACMLSGCRLVVITCCSFIFAVRREIAPQTSSLPPSLPLSLPRAQTAAWQIDAGPELVRPFISLPRRRQRHRPLRRRSGEREAAHAKLKGGGQARACACVRLAFLRDNVANLGTHESFIGWLGTRTNSRVKLSEGNHNGLKGTETRVALKKNLMSSNTMSPQYLVLLLVHFPHSLAPHAVHWGHSSNLESARLARCNWACEVQGRQRWQTASLITRVRMILDLIDLFDRKPFWLIKSNHYLPFDYRF